MAQSAARADRLTAFKTRLQAAGLREALAGLVAATDYRFIAIFRFHAGMARAVVYVDRLHPDQLTSEEVPALATYCCFVRDARGAFITANALLDPRLDGHVARETVAAYCGVPVMTPEGEILGTLCHYDSVPRDPAQIDLALMLEVSSAIEQSGLLPAYRPAAAA
ncbi:MAG: GAF domain-containing protein [Rubrivivax sp.]|nr:GAF domain-containing protein [Rubrivivax sp.]